MSGASDRRRDPARRPMPLGEWPARDRVAFERALSPGGLLDDAGAGAHLAAPTRDRRAWCYGRWLAYLQQHCMLDPEEPPLDRLRRGMDGYIAHLRAQDISSRTLWSYIDGLHGALRIMFPDQQDDWIWLRPMVNRLERAVVPARPVEPDLVSPKRLFRRGLAAMAAAERALAAGNPSRARPLAAASADPVLCAVRFRDGLLLALQAACGLRNKNLAMIRRGVHLTEASDRFWLRFAAHEMKNRQAFEKPLPRELTAPIRRYLATHRPILLAGRGGDAFWINQYGEALSYGGLSDRLAEMTGRHVGKRLRAHRFRHAIGSFVAIETPQRARAIPALLGNSLAATERYYIHGQRIAAARRHADLVADLRRETRSAQAEGTATTEDR